MNQDTHIFAWLISSTPFARLFRAAVLVQTLFFSVAIAPELNGGPATVAVVGIGFIPLTSAMSLGASVGLLHLLARGVPERRREWIRQAASRNAWRLPLAIGGVVLLVVLGNAHRLAFGVQ